jgi:hypothetical protein
MGREEQVMYVVIDGRQTMRRRLLIEPINLRLQVKSSPPHSQGVWNIVSR